MSVDKVYEIKCQTCKENEALFDKQWKRSMEAIKLWQKENDPDIWPDLGTLFEWLIKKAGLDNESKLENNEKNTYQCACGRKIPLTQCCLFCG